MERAELEQKIEEILRQEKTLPAERINPQQPLSELGFDSLDALNLLFAIEEKFGVSIPDDQARSIRTMGDLANVVEGLSQS